MKILMLVPYLPNTRMSGGQTRWFNLIKYLSKKHQITLFSLIKDDSEKRYIPELRKYCQKVMVFNRPKKPWTLRNILLSQLGPFPLLVIRNWSFKERQAIKKELASEKYDLVHAETFYVMPHLAKTNVPTILVEQTIWHEVYRHYVVNNTPLILRPFFMFDIAKVKFWEKHYWKKADQLVAVSEDDRKVMQKLLPGTGVDIIPNGVDSSHYAEKKIDRFDPPRILYGVTNFEWLQNQEATEILIHQIMPKIKKKIPNVKVWIVGRKMPDWLTDLAKKEKDVEITENIPYARDAYRQASLMVAPIRGAGGTRLKILEAMASGLAVVSTQIGVTGLKVSHGKQALIADSSEGLAEEAIKLLKNPELSEKIGKSGREHVRKYFDWQSIVKLHDPIYKKLIRL